MSEEETATKLPPYVSFKSFMKLIENLGAFVPGQLDRSYMLNAAKFNGSTATQILTACRFLKLVKGLVPEPLLHEWVKQEGDEWKKTFQKILRVAYAPIFELDLEKATDQMLRDAFRKTYGADGEVGSKCIAFFVQASQRAGIPLSHIITQRAKTVSLVGRPKGKRHPRTADEIEVDGTAPPVADVTPSVPTNPSEFEWAKFRLLVEKFPRFDPTWSDELKMKWFAAYESFMRANIGPVGS